MRLEARGARRMHGKSYTEIAVRAGLRHGVRGREDAKRGVDDNLVRI